MALHDLESCLGTLNAPCDRIASLDGLRALRTGANVDEVANVFQPYQIARRLGTEIETLKPQYTHPQSTILETPSSSSKNYARINRGRKLWAY